MCVSAVAATAVCDLGVALAFGTREARAARRICETVLRTDGHRDECSREECAPPLKRELDLMCKNRR